MRFGNKLFLQAKDHEFVISKDKLVLLKHLKQDSFYKKAKVSLSKLIIGCYGHGTSSMVDFMKEIITTLSTMARCSTDFILHGDTPW